MTKYRIKCHCKACGHTWKIYSSHADAKPRKCPNKTCREIQTSIGFDPQGSAPAIAGQKNIVKAVDFAARIAMEDYKLTDLKDNIREGDVMAPRLSPKQQALADGFFGGNTPADRQTRQQQMQMKRIMRNAIGGAYRASALDLKAVLPDNRVALHKYRDEKPGR